MMSTQISARYSSLCSLGLVWLAAAQLGCEQGSVDRSSRAAFSPSSSGRGLDAQGELPATLPAGDALEPGGSSGAVEGEPGGLGGEVEGDLGGEVGGVDVEPMPDIVLDVSGDSPTLPVRETVELASFFPENAELVGVAVDPSDGGTRYVLEARTGLYALSDTGAELVFDLQVSTVLSIDGAVGPPEELTDVAFDPSRSSPDLPSFVLTAENDGYIAGLHNSLLNSYFCYFPRTSSGPAVAPSSISVGLRERGIDIKERTEAVTLSQLTGQIFAQPRTIRLDSGEIAGSELFVFEAFGGQPVNTRRFASLDFAAGGMAVLFDSLLSLGHGPDLYVSPGWESDARRFGTLGGVQAITGMALDVDGHLLVLDGPGKRLVQIDVNALREALGPL